MRYLWNVIKNKYCNLTSLKFEISDFKWKWRRQNNLYNKVMKSWLISRCLDKSVLILPNFWSVFSIHFDLLIRMSSGEPFKLTRPNSSKKSFLFNNIFFGKTQKCSTDASSILIRPNSWQVFSLINLFLTKDRNMQVQHHSLSQDFATINCFLVF